VNTVEPDGKERHDSRFPKGLTKLMSNSMLEERLAELEMRLAFQDDVIHTLSEQVAKQELDIRELWEAKRLMHTQLKSMAPSNIRREDEETPPPHY
jgi:SlyX protein